MGLFSEYGMSIFATLFWLKAATIGLTVFFISSYKNKEFYYYQNLGVSKLLLGVSTSLFDFLLWLTISIIAYKIK